jgi:hypothetical protein
LASFCQCFTPIMLGLFGLMLWTVGSRFGFEVCETGFEFIPPPVFGMAIDPLG